jgi:hypothetical protein
LFTILGIARFLSVDVIGLILILTFPAIFLLLPNFMWYVSQQDNK